MPFTTCTIRNDANKIAAHNAGWPSQFRFAVHAGWSRVPELWTLDHHRATRWVCVLICREWRWLWRMRKRCSRDAIWESGEYGWSGESVAIGRWAVGGCESRWR
jgi:hypothetical protein